MNRIVYIVGAVVIVLAILSLPRWVSSTSRQVKQAVRRVPATLPFGKYLVCAPFPRITPVTPPAY